MPSFCLCSRNKNWLVNLPSTTMSTAGPHYQSMAAENWFIPSWSEYCPSSLFLLSLFERQKSIFSSFSKGFCWHSPKLLLPLTIHWIVNGLCGHRACELQELQTHCSSRAPEPTGDHLIRSWEITLWFLPKIYLITPAFVLSGLEPTFFVENMRSPLS